MNCDYTDPGGAPLERIAQQQAGTHPAPCARSCEANAYQIELRRYRAEVEQFRADARRFRLAEKNLFDVQEAAKTIAKQAIAAEAERDTLAAKLKDAEHDRDEFRRVMNGFAEKMAELEGQEPVAWMTANREMTSFVNFHDDDLPLYARQVPAERPVNARLLDVATGKTPHLYGGRCPDYVNGPESRDPDCPACQAIVSADAQQERLLQDMHDAGREIDRVMAEPAPKEPVAGPVNARLLAALKVCRHKFAQYVAHHIGKGDMHKAMANESMVAMADVAIMAAEAAPRVARLTNPDIAKALASAGLRPEDYREDGEILPLVLAIESAALRKNGLAMED